MYRYRLLILLIFWTSYPTAVFAAENSALSLTIAPPIFQVNLAPGDVWRSAIKVVNGSTYPVDLRASLRNFHPDGETGNPVFDKSSVDKEGGRTLASWITVSSAPVHVPAGGSAQVPFMITVPKDAEPGGHYAGILIGTAPPDAKGESAIAVSSYLSSLIFTRIAGAVVEDGNIRDFYADPWFVEDHAASFTLRFENKGNVHLVPQGDITLYNMWGKERGKIVINDSNAFGNVLPETTRKFAFTWTGEANPFDIGRYKAVATLVYGAEGRKTVFRTAYFWVVPWKEALGILGGLALFAWFVARSIRSYIRNAIALERERILGSRNEGVGSRKAVKYDTVASARNQGISLTALLRPLQEGWAKHKEERKKPKETRKHKKLVAEEHRTFIVFIAVIILGFVTIGWYFAQVLEEERTYQMEMRRE